MTANYVTWLKVFGEVGKTPDLLDTVECPRCGNKQLKAQYVGSASDRIGYGALWCQNCWHGIWVSRLKVPNGWTYATFEEAEGGIIPSFIHIEPD
jgi:hypothetical protein